MAEAGETARIHRIIGRDQARQHRRGPSMPPRFQV